MMIRMMTTTWHHPGLTLCRETVQPFTCILSLSRTTMLQRVASLLAQTEENLPAVQETWV